MTPDQSRPILTELLYVLNRTHRFYRVAVVQAPPAIREQFDGWRLLCDLANRTAAQTQLLLERTTPVDLDLELSPPAFLTHELTERIRGRRAAMSQPPVPRPRLH